MNLGKTSSNQNAGKLDDIGSHLPWETKNGDVKAERGFIGAGLQAPQKNADAKRGSMGQTPMTYLMTGAFILKNNSYSST